MLATDEIVPVILLMNEEYFLPYCLESIKGRFKRYVIYDIGSKDTTRDIIKNFIETSPKGTQIYYRYLPFLEPSIQGIFRNSMIAEAKSDWYMIVDGDEIYPKESINALISEFDNMKELYMAQGRTYGIVRRVELTEDLRSAYGQNLDVPHHRIYHRRMIWSGSHPGEVPETPQVRGTEHWFSKKVVCYHMHNCKRSSFDEDVPKRIKRRSQSTYHPGEATPIDILKRLPILRKPILDFKCNPALAELHNDDKM